MNHPLEWQVIWLLYRLLPSTLILKLPLIANKRSSRIQWRVSVYITRYLYLTHTFTPLYPPSMYSSAPTQRPPQKIILPSSLTMHDTHIPKTVNIDQP